MEVYLDTSSFIKLYKQEKETEEVEEIMKALLDRNIELYTSYLTLPEIIRGLSKAELSEKELEEVESDFRNYADKGGLVLIPISNEIIDKAIKYIKENKLFVIDAIHLATALEHSEVLITNDKQLLKESLRLLTRCKMEVMTPSNFVTLL